MEATNRSTLADGETKVRSQLPRMSHELTTNAGPKTIACYYCSKKCHTQKECHLNLKHDSQIRNVIKQWHE